MKLIHTLTSAAIICSLAMMIACEKKQENESKGIRTSTERVEQSPESNAAQVSPPGKANLIVDPDFSRIGTDWTLQKNAPGEQSNTQLAQVKQVLPRGQNVKCLEVKTNGFAQVFSKNIKVDPTKCYRFSVWIKQDRTEFGTRWFGFHPYGKDGNYLNVIKPDGSPENNPYFYMGNLKDGEWHQMVGYLVPMNMGGNWTAPADSTAPTYFRMPEITDMLHIRLLNAYNKGTEVKAYFALPSVEEVALSANR